MMVDIALEPPGQRLQKARERAQWSVERVAFTLNLPVSTLLSLEQDLYHQLHGEAYVVAYIRSYAELFDLDSQALVEAYKTRQQQHQVIELGYAGAQIQSQHKKYKTGYGVAAAITLMAALSLLSPSDDKITASEVDDHLRIDTAAGVTVIESLANLPADNPTGDLVPQLSSAYQPDAGQVHGTLDEHIVFGKTLPTENNKYSRLHFHFSADCWVEVYDGNDQRIYAALQHADQTLELDGKPPFRITLGYAPGVELSYNGQRIDIDTNNADIAKLVLGNS